MKIKGIVLFIVCCLPFPGEAADTTRFVVLSSSKPAGTHWMVSAAPNEYQFFYEYNDRGRGPRLNSSALVDANGIVVRYSVTGNDYFKAPVTENYEAINGTSKWKNHIENEEKTYNGKSVYSPLNGTPAEIQLVLRALLKAKDHKLDVLPAGFVQAVHTKNHTTKINGFSEELELYSFTGSGGPPSYAWFTPKKEFFASVSGWASVIELGYESIVPELLESQQMVERDYFLLQAQKFTQVQKAPVAITNVSIFDAVSGKKLTGKTVVMENGKITAIGKSKKVKVPANARVIDGKGKTLLPGLWDNHAHYDPTQGLYHLAGGVTNIKDMANSLDLPEAKKKVDNNELLGPEISIMSGFIDFAGPYAGPTGKIVKTLDEGIDGVNYYADHGYQQIKLYSSIPPDWVKPLAEQAHKRGLKVVGHIPSFMTAERAVKDGYDQIIHLNMIMLNFLGDTIDTRSMLRFIRVGERARTIDLNSPSVKQFIQLLKERNIVVDPTSAIFESMFTNEPGKLAKGYESTVQNFPTELKRGLYYGGLPQMKGHEKEFNESFERMISMLGLLHKNGITILPGTDDFPGFALHRELELYAKSGMANADILKAATLTSAKVAKVDHELGSIEVGKKANLILVDGDPVKNISDIRKVELTIKNGNLYDPKAMYQSYGFGFWK